jgi:dUTP pyrophosphatase
VELKPELKVIRLHEHVDMPEYAYEKDSGFDLRSSVNSFRIDPGEIKVVPTGLKLLLPEGYEGQVRSKSGLSSKHGIAVVNSPGTIDNGYTGEIKVICINLGRDPYTIEKGSKIAQFVISPYVQASFEEVKQGSEPVSERSGRGFGSSG